MSDLFDTSRIGDNDLHWDALAKRVAEHAMRRSKASGLDWLTHRQAGLVAAGLLLVAALVSLAGSADEPSSANFTPIAIQAFGPPDAAGKVIVKSEQPPAVGALLFSSGPIR